MKAAIPLTLLAFLGVAHADSKPRIRTDLSGMRCYPIVDRLHPEKRSVDLTDMFGLARDCTVRTPARMLCTEAHSNGAGSNNFLCYRATCPDDPAPGSLAVSDRFGRRDVKVERGRFFCAPADPEQCGDGEIDPGEQCDGNISLCTTADCNDDCTCNFPDCCQCENMCYDANFCPIECEHISGGSCGGDGWCQEPPIIGTGR